MRRKKHKHTRRGVVFYKLNYGFHEPYKVLVDGNFVHAAMSTGLSDLDDHVSKLLGARVKLYVTRCVTREMQQMGPDLAEALKAARRYELHKCGHEAGECTPATCIRQAIGTANSDRWWVATQDQALRAELEEIPACPIIFTTINGIHLHQPPGLARQTAKQVSVSQQTLPSHERGSSALKDLEEIRPRIKTSATFRRNKAKGPNPLSVRPKKVKVKATGPAPDGGAAAHDQQQQPVDRPVAPVVRKRPRSTGDKEGRGAVAGSDGVNGLQQDQGAAPKRKRKRGPAAEAAAS